MKIKEGFTLGEIIKEELDERGWNLEKLACEMHKREIQCTILELELILAYEGKNMTLDDQTAERLSQALEVPKEFFHNLNDSTRKKIEGWSRRRRSRV